MNWGSFYSFFLPYPQTNYYAALTSDLVVSKLRLYVLVITSCRSRFQSSCSYLPQPPPTTEAYTTLHNVNCHLLCVRLSWCIKFKSNELVIKWVQIDMTPCKLQARPTYTIIHTCVLYTVLVHNGSMQQWREDNCHVFMYDTVFISCGYVTCLCFPPTLTEEE